MSGPITADTVWNADLVRVWGDVTVTPGVTLTIVSGVRVEFQEYYRIAVAGTLLAEGTPAARIVFTAAAPQYFSIDHGHGGCWNGIRFEQTASTNGPSRLAYCVLEYSKAVGGGGLYAREGGALSAVEFSKLTIENCIFRNNVADHGGALFFYRHASPVVADNLIVGNHALQNASAVYCAYSCPQLANNTIVGNRIENEQDPYIDTCAVLNFIGKPRLTNNIIRDNDPHMPYIHVQVWMGKDYYTRYNDIAGYVGVGGIDADPRFVQPGYWDDQGTPGWSDDEWVDGDQRLGTGSPCIDAGENAAAQGLLLDLAGSARFRDDPATADTGAGTPPLVDMGTYEFQPAAFWAGDLNCDGQIDALDIDPFVLALTDPAGYEAAFPDCDAKLADCSGDGTVDAFDIDPFVALLAGA